MRKKRIHQDREPINCIPLKSVRELEFLLGTNRADLQALSDWRSNYRSFELTTTPKPHSKRIADRKVRRIDNPSKELKRVQTRILRELLLPVGFGDFQYGAVPLRSIRTHASAHLGAKLVIRMDIKNYYPSITNRQIYALWSHTLRCSPPVARLLTHLTTCRFRLPQGSPASPALANIFLASICSDVLRTCEEKGVRITVWVDDVTLSGERAREVMDCVRSMLIRNGLKDSAKKRTILSSRDRKVVTGVRLGANELRVCPAKLSDLRAGIHNFKLGKYTSAGRDHDLCSLRGKVAFVSSLCSRDALKLQRELDAIGSRVS